MQALVCKRYCSFYKPDGPEERQKCGTYEFLSRNLTERELSHLAIVAPEGIDLSADTSIKAMVCEQCEFLKDGCDFRDGVDSPPCGGYALMEFLLKQPH